MNAQMMLISVVESGVDTFQLIPLTKDSCFMEALYNRQKEVLTLIHPLSFETLQMVARVNDHGVFEKSPANQSGYKQERLRLKKHFDFQLTNKSEIQELVNCLTGKPQDLSKYFEPLPKTEHPQQNAIASPELGPTLKKVETEKE